MATENIKDIISCGFNPEKTFIFTNSSYIKNLYPNILKIQKHTTFNQVKSIFGIINTDNIGKLSFPPIQIAPAFSTSFPHIFTKKTKCLIICAIDQDPYFRMARDVAKKLHYYKPSLLHAKFLPSLKGVNKKMSSSVPLSAIFLNDTNKIIKKKINKSFSGGKETLVEQRKYGADITIDIPSQYLTFFMNNNDELMKIKNDYSTGKLLSGEIKKILINILQTNLSYYKNNRKNITEKIMNKFINYGQNNK